MPYGVKLHVCGEYACFTRPEIKVERVSYDAMTPSGARGILEAIHWKPAIRWVVDRIHVLKPILFENLRRKELGHKVPAGNVRKAMRGGTTEGLRTLIEPPLCCGMSPTLSRPISSSPILRRSTTPSPSTWRCSINRRAVKGQCFHRPYLGTREFGADFALVENEMPESCLPPDQHNRDLGWMLHDIDYANGMSPRFFRAALRDGAIDVPPLDATEVKA